MFLLLPRLSPNLCLIWCPIDTCTTTIKSKNERCQFRSYTYPSIFTSFSGLSKKKTKFKLFIPIDKINALGICLCICVGFLIFFFFLSRFLKFINGFIFWKYFSLSPISFFEKKNEIILSAWHCTCFKSSVCRQYVLQCGMLFVLYKYGKLLIYTDYLIMCLY